MSKTRFLARLKVLSAFRYRTESDETPRGKQREPRPHDMDHLNYWKDSQLERIPSCWVKLFL